VTWVTNCFRCGLQRLDVRYTTVGGCLPQRAIATTFCGHTTTTWRATRTKVRRRLLLRQPVPRQRLSTRRSSTRSADARSAPSSSSSLPSSSCVAARRLAAPSVVIATSSDATTPYSGHIGSRRSIVSKQYAAAAAHFPDVSKVIYRKQIARQHSCHRNFWPGLGSVIDRVKIFPFLFDHRAKFGCRVLSQRSTLRGTVNEYQLSGWVIIINGDGGCRRQKPIGGLTLQDRWLGLRVSGRLALFYIHQMNRVNSRNNPVVMMTAKIKLISSWVLLLLLLYRVDVCRRSQKIWAGGIS